MRLAFKRMKCNSQSVGHRTRCDENVILEDFRMSLANCWSYIGKDVMQLSFIERAMFSLSV